MSCKNKVEKGIATSDEKKFVQTIAVPKGDGFSIAFTHSALFEGSWEDIQSHTIATNRTMGTDPLWQTHVGVSI